MLIFLTIPVIIIIIEIKKRYPINKIYNFRRELKRIKMNPFNKTDHSENSTLIGRTSSKKPIYTPDKAKHIFICGTTGSGKTVALSNYIKSGIEKDYPLLIIDGKGDTGEGSIYDIVKSLKGNKELYVINLTNPLKSDFYNPFKNATPTIAKDMLINLTDWSEEHYKLNTERYLQRLLQLLVLSGVPLSFKSIINNMSVNKFSKLSGQLLKAELINKDEHLENIEMTKTSGKIADGAFARFSLIAESELGYIFDEAGIDIYTALEEKAIILFVLNPLIFPEMSPLIGRLLLIDSKKALSNLFGRNGNRIFFIMDEINAYASPVLIDLVNKSRSAKITCILATQSLSDLDYAVGEAFKEQIIENCNNYIVMRQNSSVNAEHWANILGTRGTLEVTYQLQQKGLNTSETGFGSAKRVREYFYHPDDIKTLKTGQGIILSKDNYFHSKVQINKPF
jgi:type IV secretory pathway TraG/TraD family ATPase VirD4